MTQHEAIVKLTEVTQSLGSRLFVAEQRICEIQHTMETESIDREFERNKAEVAGELGEFHTAIYSILNGLELSND
jgi:hypothetical protein